MLQLVALVEKRDCEYFLYPFDLKRQDCFRNESLFSIVAVTRCLKICLPCAQDKENHIGLGMPENQQEIILCIVPDYFHILFRVIISISWRVSDESTNVETRKVYSLSETRNSMFSGDVDS